MKKSKVPSWSQAQLKEAITCILTQQLRFTQASTKFKIPKGTLYDNILGKTKRSRMLEEVGLNPTVYISSTIDTDCILWQLQLQLKYGSQEKVPFWCRCSIFLSLTFVEIKKSFSRTLLVFNSMNFRIICYWKYTDESEPI